jgi:Isochorismatase family
VPGRIRTWISSPAPARTSRLTETHARPAGVGFCVLGTALTGLERGYEVYVADDATAGETLETHQVAVQRMIQAGVVPVTWLSLASQYQGSYTNHETVQGFLGLMTQHSAAFGMLFQGQAVRAR